MAREGSKRQIAIEIMNANADKSMAEVMEMIAKANNLSMGAARSYYKYLAEQGMAAGKVEKIARQKAVTVAPVKVKAEKAPKAEKKAKETKSPEEIERIKSANLARLKEVHSKRKNVVKKTDEVETVEADPFVAPVALTMDEVHALV